MKKILKKIFRRDIIIIICLVSITGFFLYMVILKNFFFYQPKLPDCSTIADIGDRDWCHWQNAKKTQNAKLCLKISTSYTDYLWPFWRIGECFKEAARNMKDCLKIADENYKLFCQALKSDHDISICSKISDYKLKDYCRGALLPPPT